MRRFGFVLAGLLWALPVAAVPLPLTVSETFTGTWNGIDLGSGVVTFDLLTDRTDIIPHAGSGMEAVDWRVTLTADNGRFTQTGDLTNIWYWNCPTCADLPTMPWEHTWFDVSDMQPPVQDYTPSGPYGLTPYPFGPAWDFATNENFLPAGMDEWGLGPTGQPGLNHAHLEFAAPEPPTGLLLGVGLALLGLVVACGRRGRVAPPAA